MCARVSQSMAQFGLKIEKLSYIMGTAPIVELARAYGLHSRLWLLVRLNMRAVVIDDAYLVVEGQVFNICLELCHLLQYNIRHCK